MTYFPQVSECLCDTPNTIYFYWLLKWIEEDLDFLLEMFSAFSFAPVRLNDSQ